MGGVKKCVGSKGRCEERCGGVRKCWGGGGCGKNCGRVYVVNVKAVGNCVGVKGEVRGDVGRGVGKCVGVWGEMWESVQVRGDAWGKGKSVWRGEGERP